MTFDPATFQSRLDRAASARRKRTHRSLTMIVAITLAILFVPLIFQPADNDTYFLAVVVSTLTLLPLTVRASRGTLDIFEPVMTISLLICLNFGIRAIYLAFDPATVRPLRLGFDPYEDYINRALAVVIAGYCCLLFGYYLVAPGVLGIFRRRQRQTRSVMWPMTRLSVPRVVTLLVISGAAIAYRVWQGDVIGDKQNVYEVTGSTFLVNAMSMLGPYAGCILALYMARGDLRPSLMVLLGGVVLPIAAFLSLAFGGKSAFLMVLYFIIAGYHYGRAPVRLRSLSVGVIAAILVVFPTVNAYRNSVNTELAGRPTTIQEFLSSLNHIPGALADRGVSGYVQLATEDVMVRSTGIDALSLIMKYGDDGQLGDASAYLNAPLYSLVPRFILPEKPVTRQSMMFGRMFLATRGESAKSFASFGIFHVGDLYATFGPTGVFIGLGLLGCFYRLVYLALKPSTEADLGRKFIYILLLWNLTNGFEADVPTLISDTLKFLVIWMAIKWFFNTRQPAANWVPARPRWATVRPRDLPLRASP